MVGPLNLLVLKYKILDCGPTEYIVHEIWGLWAHVFY